MGKKVVRLTESQLKGIVAETVKQVLNEKHLLKEMSYPRNVYKDKMDSELPQVFINWCLTRYRTITNTEQLKKLWQGEFRDHMCTISRFSIEKNDSEATRRKVLLEVLRENDFVNPQFMTLTVCNKFIEENIDVKTEFFQQTVEDCIANIGLLFDLILSREVIRIARYAETI